MHELGHQWEVETMEGQTHVGGQVNHKNHANTDECIMTYYKKIGETKSVGNDPTNGIAEFCTDCLYWIRKHDTGI